jgi:hypothetical protein
MATTGRRGTTVRNPNGGTSYRRAHRMHYKPAAEQTGGRGRSFAQRAELAPDLAISGLLGLIAYGLVNLVLTLVVAIIVSLVTALLTFIGRQLWHSTPRGRRRSTRRRRRGPIHKRAGRYVSRKLRLRVARSRRSWKAWRASRRKGAETAQRLEQQVTRESAGFRRRKPGQGPAARRRAAQTEEK